MTSPKIIIISGPSGSGKGTVIASLPQNYKKAVSVTTRAMRPGEIEGIDYFFISHDRFDALQREGGILEYNYYDGNYYGTPRFQITDILSQGNHVVLDVDVNGAVNIKKAYPEALSVFLMAPDVHVQESRIRGRNTNSEASILARIEQAKTELTFADSFDCLVINENGRTEATVQAILHAVEGRYDDQDYAKNKLIHYFD